MKRTTFAGDVLRLVSGTTVAQVLIIIAAPILARLYLPEYIGLAAIFTAITTVLIGISGLRYEISIMLPESDEEAASLFGLSVLIVTAISIILLPIILLVKKPFVALIKSPELEPFLIYVPVMIFFGGLLLALNQWNVRKKNFARISIVNVSNSAITTTGQIGAGLTGYTSGGSLISASVVGAAITSILLACRVWASDARLFRSHIHFRHLLAGLVRHKKFPIYDTPAVLLNSISWQLPAFLLAGFFSTTEVGYYALGNRLLRFPMTFIGTSIAQVFFQRAAEAKNTGTLNQIVENVFTRLVSFGLFPLLLLTIVGRDVFVVILGDNWAEAGVYTQILSVWMFFWFISSPISILFRVLEKQEFSLRLNMVIFLSRLIVLTIGGLIGNARITMLLFSITGVLLYGYLSLSIIITSGVRPKHVFNILSKYFVIFLPCGSLMLLLKILSATPIIMTLATGGLVIVYYIYIARSDPSMNLYLSGLLRRIPKN